MPNDEFNWKPLTWTNSNPYQQDGQLSWGKNDIFHQDADQKFFDEKPFAYPSDRPTYFQAKFITFMPIIIFLIVALITLHILHKKCRQCKKNRRDRKASRPPRHARGQQRTVTSDRVSHVNERRNEAPPLIQAQVHRPITPSAPSLRSDDQDFILPASPAVPPRIAPQSSNPPPADDLPPSYNEVVQQQHR